VISIALHPSVTDKYVRYKQVLFQVLDQVITGNEPGKQLPNYVRKIHIMFAVIPLITHNSETRNRS
jgi:hypothetical protein